MASGYSNLSEIQKASKTYGLQQKPPKINLLNERPRRESQVEQQLSGVIVRPPPINPILSGGSREQLEYAHRSQPNVTGELSRGMNDFTRESWSGQCLASSSTRGLPPINKSELDQFESGFSGNSRNELEPVEQINEFPDFARLEADLAAKEAILKREIAYLNQYQNPWSRPKQTRDPRREPPPRSSRSSQRWLKECPSPSTSRPTSRASSTRSTTESDLLEKATKLLQDVEELEKKPMNQQQILIEGGIRTLDSNFPSSSEPSSVHTAVIKVPKEINNKSPLPFSYDNFSTLGVRGNIASVGAAEPDTPYPPIFPTIKRTPSPRDRFN